MANDNDGRTGSVSVQSETDGGDTRIRLGHRLRELRQRRGLTVAEVAAATRLSTSFLALLERGKTEIAVSRLIRIADFYGVWFDDLLGLPNPSVDIVRASQVRRMMSHAPGVDLRVLTTSSASSIQPFVLRLAPGATHSGLPHQGQLQFTHVLAGAIRLDVGGESYVLGTDDTIYFPSRLAHVYTNETTDQALVVGAVVRSAG